MLAFAAHIAARQAGSAPSTDIVQSWGWSLLWLFLILLGGAMVLVVARWLTLGGRGGLPLGRGSPKRRKPTATSSVWEEAGRRMEVPDTDLKEEP